MTITPHLYSSRKDTPLLFAVHTVVAHLCYFITIKTICKSNWCGHIIYMCVYKQRRTNLSGDKKNFLRQKVSK